MILFLILILSHYLLLILNYLHFIYYYY